MLNYKKPAFWIIIVVCIVLACFLLNPMSTEIDDSLSAFLDGVIVNQNGGKQNGTDFSAVDCKILGVKKSGATITVYAWVLYQEYTFDGELKEGASSHIPTAITVNKTDNANESYELAEYWIPRDGSYYAGDIKGKFPIKLRNKALDSQWCIEEQQQNCLKSAREYFDAATAKTNGADTQ